MGSASSRNARFYGDGSQPNPGCTCSFLAADCKCNCVKCADGKHCYCDRFCKRKNLTKAQMRLWQSGKYEDGKSAHPLWHGPVFNAVEFNTSLSNANPVYFIADTRNGMKPAGVKHCEQCANGGCQGDCPCPCHRHINGKPIVANMYGMQMRSMDLLGYNGDRVSSGGMEGFSAGEKCVCGKTPCACKPNNYLPTPLMANMWGME